MIETALKKFETEVVGFPEQAKLIIVHDSQTLEQANEFYNVVKAMMKEIKGFFKPLKIKAKEAHQGLVDKERELLDPLEQAANITKPQISSYLDELDRLRREADEKVREEERKRERLKEEKLKAAIAAQSSGDLEKVEEIINEEIPAAKPFIPVPSSPKLEGMSIREIWKYRVINIKLVPLPYLMINSVKVGSLVRATKGKVRIPGIETYSEKV